MRAFTLLALLWLTGCQSLTIGTGGVPATPAGGGGGGSLQTESACPVDVGQALQEAIAQVPDRLARDALSVQWRYVDAISNLGSLSRQQQAVAAFQNACVRLEQQGQLSSEASARLQGLIRCYLAP